ncbi:MAG: cell division protein FtsQ/DivIB [Bradymonadia bacterium]
MKRRARSTAQTRKAGQKTARKTPKSKANRRQPTGEYAAAAPTGVHRAVADTLMTTIAPALEPVKVLVIEGVGPIKAMVKPAVALIVLALLGWVGWSYAKTSAYFNLRQIQAEATPHLSVEMALQLTGLEQPVNAFVFDPEEARQQLLGDPWVAEAEVEVKLPNTVTLLWAERKPVAVIFQGGALHLVDHLGTPFVQATAEEAGDLPLISGMTADTYETSPEEARGRIRAALRLYQRYMETPLAASHPLSNVHIGIGDDLELMLGRTRVALGSGSYGEKLYRLQAVYDTLDERGMGAAYILMETDGGRAIVKEIPLTGDGA